MKKARPELLAPAGNREMIQAAVENGADAVYFGVQAFNARLRAENFSISGLLELMQFIHARGVKGYLTLNTLVFNDELEEAAQLIKAAVRAGVDALLVQDLGIAALANRICPELEIHASTQMTISSPESVQALGRLGIRVERVVAPRELSLRDVERFIKDSPASIEVFVHGALCVAYSGQCLTSEALGGRSANRGECAQACRLPYDLVVDGVPRDLGDISYLLSPKDLAAYGDVARLAEIGAASIKIEGRLKSPEYVAAAVQAYRKVLDAEDSQAGLDELSVRKLESTFSRGFTGGYLHGIDHQAVVEGRFPKKRGTYLGRVVEVSSAGIAAALEAPLKPGDGVVFDAGRPEDDEEGGRVFELKRAGLRLPAFDGAPRKGQGVKILLTFERGKLDFKRIKIGDRVWKTSDPEIEGQLRASFAGEQIRHRRPVSAAVWGSPGAPLRLRLRDFEGFEVEAVDELPAERAHTRPLDYETLWSALSRLGAGPFVLETLTTDLQGPLMVPLSRLNRLRRRAVDELLSMRHKIGHYRRIEEISVGEFRGALGEVAAERPPSAPVLSVLCRSLEQVEACGGLGIETIYVDFEDPKHYPDARSLIPSGSRFVPAGLRIFKPGESGFVKKLLQCSPDGLLVRSLGMLEAVRSSAPDMSLYGDYALNTANDLSARLLMAQGFKRLTPSFDLNSDQLRVMVEASVPDWFEVVVHQHMPLFHMEHCVFCRFLSSGTDASNCGRPCEKSRVELRDRKGYSHPLKADAGCRNTLFNAVRQSGAEYLPQFLTIGLRLFRIDLLLESAKETEEVVKLYRGALGGKVSGRELWRTLRAESRLGVTRGSLDRWMDDRSNSVGER